MTKNAKEVKARFRPIVLFLHGHLELLETGKTASVVRRAEDCVYRHLSGQLRDETSRACSARDG
jgi:hypothetical protein